MTFIREGRKVSTCDLPPGTGLYLLWLCVMSMA
jgi:hypothetical protein